MTEPALVALGSAAAFAVLNWIAVARRNKPLEYVAKPATMLALIVAAIALQPVSQSQRIMFVVALGFSLAGDVFLMLPGDRFIPGVAAFFAAHVAYVVGFRIDNASTVMLAIGTALLIVFVATIGMRILAAVRDTDPKLVTPVTAYIAVISVMVASAIATREPIAIAGASVFMLSDTLIAWNRFVQPLGWAPVAIIVTYHAGQTALVLSLLR